MKDEEKFFWGLTHFYMEYEWNKSSTNEIKFLTFYVLGWSKGECVSRDARDGLLSFYI